MTSFVGKLAALAIALLVTPRAATAATPVATDDVVAVEAGVAGTFDLAANDHDADGDALSVVSATAASHGTVSVAAGSVTYAPDPGYVGEDSFGYVVDDGSSTDSGSVRVFVNASLDGAAARAAILSGVSTFATDGYGGPVVAFGPTAFPLTEAPRGTGSFGGWTSAVATLGAGRVVAMGDHQALEASSRGSVGDTARFYANAIAWLADSSAKSVRIVTVTSATATWLASQGFTNVVTTNEAGLAAALAGADVLLPGWLGSSEPQSNLDAIAAFVEAGGGLFLADFGWGYTGGWWNKPIAQAPGNLLLRGAGVGFPDGIFWDSGAVAATPAVGQPNADLLLDLLADSSAATDEEKRFAASVLDSIGDVLPPDDLLLALADRFFDARIASIHATPANPVAELFDQALLRREADLLEATPAAQVTAHRDAAAVYGAIDPATPRVTRTVPIDGSRGRWHPTGLYAVPGELVTVTVPSALVGKGYKVRIGAHTDDVSQRSSWLRPPRVHRWFPIDATVVPVANAFGGSIFVDLGGGAESASPGLGTFQVTVAGAIEQPYFELGRHVDADWTGGARDRGAPWAVLASPNLVISIPSSDVRALATPTSLMTWWNDVITHQDALASHVAPRTGGELINVDVQNSAGSAHSGYPVQAWDIYWGNLADEEELVCNGSWGDFHELGHNHQRGWWTFPGDGEVSVNIFSNESLESKALRPQGGWGYSADPAQVMAEAISNVSGGGTYSQKGSRWSFWFQLADGFGWDAYRGVFAGYEQDAASNPSALPQNDQQEKDQWFVRFSNRVGFDMKRFMVDTWGLEVGASAMAAVSSLPDWMPLAGGVPETAVLAGSSATIDVAGGALSMDGVATVVSVGAPSHGTLEAQGDGTWRYRPEPGFVGSDSFDYVLRSSAGNEQSFAAAIDVVTGVVADYWYGISGSSLSSLESDPRFPGSPDESVRLTSFELPKDRAGSYGARVRGFVVPPTTGLYTFWIASDDQGALLLSPDDSASNAVRIASVPGYTSWRQWTRYAEQRSAKVPLVAGRRYYLEARMKEGGGGDHLSVAWSGPGLCGPVPVPASASVEFATPQSSCPSVPRVGCAAAPKSQVLLGAAVDARGGRLQWKWDKGTASPADFGAPTTTTMTTVCAWDDRGLVESAVVPPGGTCGTRPCWKSSTRGHAYADKARSIDGVGKLSLLGSAVPAKGSVQVDARGAAVSPPLPVEGTLVVQVANDANTNCFGATYPAASAKTSTATQFKAQRR